jgi:hypothetical protein
VKYYKVLRNGRSFHGGDMAWSLPDGDTPGEWHEVTGALSLCRHGLHLTSEPAKWWAPDASAFEAEYEGDLVTDGGDKVAVRRCRLVRRVESVGLEKIGILASGEHRVSSGYWWAYGSATVEAYGSATVRAYGSATVRAYGFATVEASGSATVEAYDFATVRASGSTTVEAYGSATVRASGFATVRAGGSTTAEAYDSATVISARLHSGKAIITLRDEAAHVDRRDGLKFGRAKVTT